MVLSVSLHISVAVVGLTILDILTLAIMVAAVFMGPAA
jgi:hypothetical protein